MERWGRDLEGDPSNGWSQVVVLADGELEGSLPRRLWPAEICQARLVIIMFWCPAWPHGVFGKTLW